MTNVELRVDYKPKGDAHCSTKSSKLYNVYSRTEINFNTQERFFAPTVEIMEQKWLSQ